MMSGKQFAVVVVLVVIAGLLGGAMAELLLHGTPAAAQAAGGRPSVVKATSFVLTDADGKTQATLGLEKGLPTLCIYDAAGRRGALLGMNPAGLPNLILYGPKGKDSTVIDPTGLISEANPQPSP